MLVIFRCDSSLGIGSGHVMRCLSLADFLRKGGSKIVFICRDYYGSSIKFIESLGYQVLLIGSDADRSVDKLGLACFELFSTSESEDATETLKLMNEIGKVDWVVVDHYGIGASWENQIKRHGARILVIDDLADRLHECEILLDQNFHSNGRQRYKNLVPDKCTLLLGPAYALLRGEFQIERKNIKKNIDGIKRVFIFFGGSDLSNETKKAIDAIKNLNLKNVEIDVLIGNANPYSEKIIEACRDFSNISVHGEVTNIAKMLSSADLAIGAGGVTMWERCCLGLPSIVIANAANQMPGCEALSAIGGILYLGESKVCDGVLLESALRICMRSPHLLNRMSEVGLSLVDGAGIGRVANNIYRKPLSLRSATNKDLAVLFDWRNDKSVARNTFNQDPIAWDVHQKWFYEKLNSLESIILIGEVDEVPIGVLRYEIRNPKTALVSIYLDPNTQGRGYGYQLLLEGEKWLNLMFPAITETIAEIIEGNNASEIIFSKAEFLPYFTTYKKSIGSKRKLEDAF